MLHAWWGLNATMMAICQRLADSGFIAFAPDLYHGQVAATIPEAESLGGALDANYLQAQAEIAEAAKYLAERSGQAEQGLAVVSFSLGAYYALLLAAAEPELIHSVVLFYGAGGGDFSASKAAYLGHFAEHDPYELQADVDELAQYLRSLGRPVDFYTYPGTGHWFFEPDRTDAYNEAAANLAWERTLAFLKRRALLNGLQAEYRQWEAFLNAIDPSLMEQPGVAGHWSIKDIVAHLTGWRIRTVARLEAARRGEAAPPPPWPGQLQTDDEINAWIYEANREHSLQQVLDELQQVFEQLLTAIEGLPDAVFIDPTGQLPWLESAPLNASDFFAHFHDEHEADIRAWLARVAQQ